MDVMMCTHFSRNGWGAIRAFALRARVARSALIMCAALLALSATTVMAQRAATHMIEGFVVDDESLPVRYATVSLEGSDIAATTDSLGVFVLRNVPTGTYAVSVRKSCAVAGYVPSVSIPRPLKVPLPLTAHRIACGRSVTALSTDDQAFLIGVAFASLARPESRDLAGALAGDGAFTFVSLNATTSKATPGGGQEVPVVIASELAATEVGELGPVGLAFCLTAPDARTCLVLVELINEKAAVPIDVLQAERALFTFERRSDSAWTLIHRVYCLTDPSPGTTGDNGNGS